jgi:ankyrin repeat protein
MCVPLYWYAVREDIAAMRAILEYGAEVNPVAPGGMTPLHEAAQRNLDTVELLVEHGLGGTKLIRSVLFCPPRFHGIGFFS